MAPFFPTNVAEGQTVLDRVVDAASARGGVSPTMTTPTANDTSPHAKTRHTASRTGPTLLVPR
jgi:hypothetical protein